MIFKNATLSLKSFFVYIDRVFFTPELGSYEYIKLDSFAFKWAVLGIYFGLVFATLVAFYNRVVLGALPRAVYANGCFSRDDAKTLDELGCKKTPFLVFSLRFGSLLRRQIRCVEEENWNEENAKNPSGRSRFADFWLPEKKYKIDLEKDRFYIPEEKKYSVDARFAKKGNGILPLIITVVGGIIAVALIFKFSPMLFEFIDGVISGFNQDNVV